MSNIQLANNLRYLRKRNSLTQDTLSDMLNISRQAYSNYETGKRMPDLDSLLLISRFYHLSLDELILGNLCERADASSRIAEEGTPYILTKEKKTGNTLYLSDEELDFIMKFRALSAENKKIITGFLSGSK